MAELYPTAAIEGRVEPLPRPSVGYGFAHIVRQIGGSGDFYRSTVIQRPVYNAGTFGVMKMDDKQLAQAIADQPHEKVTAEAMKSRIKEVSYMILPNSTVTICNIELDNGYSVRGEAACVDPRNFNMQIGRELAYRDAFNKLWPLFGFLLAEQRTERARVKTQRVDDPDRYDFQHDPGDSRS